MGSEPQPSPLLEAAIQLHEVYQTLRAAGFSERQSLIIVTNILLGKDNPYG